MRIHFRYRVPVVLAFMALATIAWGQSNPPISFLGQFNDHAEAGYNDCWGYTAPDGREYALLGVQTGTSIIDITDAPTLVEKAFIPGATSPWKDIKSYRQYAYVVTDAYGVGLQIIDLSQLPDTATLVVNLTDIFTTSHNIYIDTTRALLYVVGNASEPVYLLSLADPINPTKLSSFGPTGWSIHDIYARGDKAYISEGSLGSWSIYDVSNPAQPSFLKQFTYGNPGYAHNAWLSDDGNFLMTTEEAPGKTVKYWDISDLNNVVERGSYLGDSLLAHNAHIKGNYAYISHYKNGLKIVDLSNPDQLTEVASYNTYEYVPGPPNDYQGAWGAFPFFASGKVLVSDIERGLFVLYYPPAVVTHVESSRQLVPGGMQLEQNYPNPFNPSTTIRFGLPVRSVVRLTVHDVLGREIALLAEGELSAGTHTVTWDARRYPSGLYFTTLHSNDGILTRRMILLK